MNMDGPWGHNARLALDQADVQKAKIKMTNKEVLVPKIGIVIKYRQHAVRAIQMDAIKPSTKLCIDSGTMGPDWRFTRFLMYFSTEGKEFKRGGKTSFTKKTIGIDNTGAPTG